MAGMYTVQLDTTQDISVVDQCSVIIRYVNGTTIHETLIGIVKYTSSKGTDLVELILKVFNSMNLDPKSVLVLLLMEQLICRGSIVDFLLS